LRGIGWQADPHQRADDRQSDQDLSKRHPSLASGRRLNRHVNP
jgi:hypothetical protein